MPFKPPNNPAVIGNEAMSNFAGIHGERLEVLRIYNSKGHEISKQYANELIDLDCNVRGQMRLRPGFTKTALTGGTSTIRAIFEVRLGGQNYYAVDEGGTVKLIDLERYVLPSPTPLPESTKPTDYPADLPDPDGKDPVNDAPLDDPSVPPEEQACTVGYVATSSPATLTFEMVEGGPLPDLQNWYFIMTGWFPSSVIYLDFKAVASWLNHYQITYQNTLLAPCKWLHVQYYNVKITNNALALPVGSYTTDIQLTGPDVAVICAVTLNVTIAPSTPLTFITTVIDVPGGLRAGYPRTHTVDWTGTAGAYVLKMRYHGVLTGDQVRQKTDGTWEAYTGINWYACGNPLIGSVAGSDPDSLHDYSFTYTWTLAVT